MDASKLIPKWVRGLLVLLALANLAYGVMGYFGTSQLFPDLSMVPGLHSDNALLVHASQEFAARNLAIGLALMIVALRGVRESIAILMIVRALIEVQTLIQALCHNAPLPVMLMAGVFLLLEVFLLVTVVRLPHPEQATRVPDL